MNFNFNNNNKQKNRFVSDNLSRHYDNLKKDLKRANILFPSTEGRDEAEDEIKEWESKTNQDKKSRDKEFSQFLSLGDSELSPLLKKSSEKNENKKPNKEKGVAMGEAAPLKENNEEKPLTLKGYVSKTVYSEDKNDEKDKEKFSYQNEIKKVGDNKNELSVSEDSTTKDENRKNIKDEIKTKVWELGIRASKKPIIEKATSIFGSDTAGMLNIAEGKSVPIYTKDAKRVSSVYDINSKVQDNESLLKWQLYMEEKIKKQFKPFNYDTKNVEGYIFKNNSDVVRRIKDSEDFKEIIKENKEKIKDGKRFSGAFSKSGNLHRAFNNVDFLNGGVDKNGNLHLYMFDTYDFNKGGSPMVEAGRRLMQNGELKGFFTIHDIIIKKEDLPKYDLQITGK